MKKSFVIVLGMVILGSLLICPIVYAINSAYAYTDYEATNTHVEDGKWTTPTEWNDAMTISPLVSGFSWRGTWTYPSDIIQHFIIEDFYDTTNKTGDVVNVCYDTTASGGSAPSSADIKVELVGDSTSGLSVYKGNGTGWAKISFTPADVSVGVSFSSSPLYSTPHLIVEFAIDKSTIADVSGSGYAPGVYLSAYDASNTTAGVLSWPPAPAASANVPNSWGQETGTTSTIPESLTIGAIALLSFVAVAVSFYFLPKHPKLKITTTGK